MGQNRIRGGGGSKIVENCRTSFMHVPLIAQISLAILNFISVEKTPSKQMG